MGVTSIGGHTRPDCNARYDVRIKLVETWLFVCLTWRGNVGRLFVTVLHVVLTPKKAWTLSDRELINWVTCLTYSILTGCGMQWRLWLLSSVRPSVRTSTPSCYWMWNVTFTNFEFEVQFVLNLIIGHKRHGRSTAVKMYPLTSATWLYRELRCTTHWSDGFYKVLRWSVITFQLIAEEEFKLLLAYGKSWIIAEKIPLKIPRELRYQLPLAKSLY